MLARKSTTKDPQEAQLFKSVAAQLPKLQSGLREMQGVGKGNAAARSALGRGVLKDAQQLAKSSTELSSLVASALSRVVASDGSNEVGKDGRLGALEVMLLCSLMVELSVACIAVRNRLPHHSHIPLLLVSFSIAAHFALHPHS